MLNLSEIYVSVIVAAVSFVMLFSSADAACIASTRMAKFPDGSVRMKIYSCSLTGAVRPAVQVEFDRLSEAAAGSIIEGSPYKDLNSLYESATVLHNDVYNEAKTLFDNYGIRLYDENCYVALLSSAEGDAYHTKNQPCQEKRVLWYFTFPDQNDLTAKAYPDGWGVNLKDSKWSQKWNFYYTDDTRCADLSCVILWRYLNESDLKNYISDVHANESKIGVPLFVTNFGQAIGKEDGTDRYFSLVNHIASGNIPNDFLVLVTSVPNQCGCGGGEGDGIHIRNLLVHTVIIKNISDDAITINALTAGIDEGTVLRPYVDGKRPSSFSRNSISPVTILPGNSLVVPTRLNFVPSDSLSDLFRDSATARRTYEHISGGSDEFITSSCNGSMIRVRKAEFAAPTRPSPRIYSYGPAITVKGMSIGGTEVDFDRPLSNFFGVAAGWGYGSCPYVYAVDAGEHEWVRHGKTIDNASSPAKEMTQRLELPGAVTRFKISEEELELTFVHKVRLELTLADGRAVSLMPRNRLRPESANYYDKIKYGTEREYDFDLPFGIDQAKVRKSTLSVTGYYQRYSTAASMEGQGGK
jgi:hypothetical protein